MPLGFNWEAAPLALPQLVGYAVPLRLVFTTGVIVTTLVAGSGAYVFGRVLRLGVLASALVGTVFVLSGPVFSFLGWSSTSVASWTGWMFAATVLLLRGEHRVRWICLLAVFIAMSFYSGHPETTVVVLAGIGLFVAVIFVREILQGGGWKPPARNVLDLVVSGAAGLALSAPQLLPGMQLVGASGRNGTGNYSSISIPDHGLLQLVFQGFDGWPTAGSHWFGSVSYEWTADYVGLIAVVLAVVAVGTRWRQRAEVPALVLVAVVMGALALFRPLASGLNGLPIVGNVILSFATVPLAIAIAALAGIGIDALVRDIAKPNARRWALWSFAAANVVLAALWLFGRGHLPADQTHIRNLSFVWPFASALVGFGGALWLEVSERRGGEPGRSRRAAWLVAGVLLLCETAFLVASAMPLWTSSSNPLRPTSAVAKLENVVGSSLVGTGSSSCIASTWLGGPEPGLLPQANTLFGVHELAIYDPLVPKSYFTTWQRLTGSAGGSSYLYQFCPAITSASLARRFGVQYVLELPGTTPPQGAIPEGRFGNELLYRIPQSGRATLVPARPGAPLPPDDAAGRVVDVQEPNPATWEMSTNASRAAVLRLHLTGVPGWHATIDGRPLALQAYSGVMLQARVPPGHHVIDVSYWPGAFTAGLLVAALTVVALAIASIVAWKRGRRIPEPAPDPADEPRVEVLSAV
jgi:hypothetical protein